MSRVRVINIKNCTHYFFDDITSVKNLDPNNIKINRKSCKIILTYYFGHITPNIIKLSITQRSTSRKYIEIYRKKIKDLIRSTNNNSNDYDKKHMKIKFNADDDLLLKKTLDILHDIITIVTSAFNNGNKYYP